MICFLLLFLLIFVNAQISFLTPEFLAQSVQSLLNIDIATLRKSLQSNILTLVTTGLNSLATSFGGSQFTLRDNYSAGQVVTSALNFILQNGFTDPIASPDELGTCDLLPRSDISCYCSAFKYDSQALYWTNPAIRARIDQIGSISAFGQNICYQDPVAYAGLVKMLCSVAYPRCPKSAKRGDSIKYSSTVRVCQSICQRVSAYHQQSLNNFQIQDVTLRNDPRVALVRPIAEKVCRAGTFFVDCNATFYDADTTTCANFTSRIRPAAVYDGVAECLRGMTTQVPAVCGTKDWQFNVASSFDSPPMCPNAPGVAMILAAGNLSAAMLDGSQLFMNKIAPSVRVTHTEHDETAQYILHMPTLSEAKLNGDVLTGVYDPKLTRDYDLSTLQWIADCGGIVSNRPTHINYTTTYRNTSIVLTFALNDNDQTTTIGNESYVVKAGAVKFTISLRNAFTFANSVTNGLRLVFTFAFQFPPFRGYNINLGVNLDKKSNDASGLLTFESSSIALKLSVPLQYERDRKFRDTSVRIDALSDPAAYFASRACPSGRVELSMEKFTDYAVFDPDIRFVYNSPDTSEPGNADIVDGAKVAPQFETTQPAALNNSGQAGVTAAIVIVVIIIIGAILAVAFVFRKKLFKLARGGAE